MNASLTIDSISQLLAISNPLSGQLVYVRGYHAGTNAGGGLFIFDSESLDVADGGTVFLPDDFTQGRWLRQFDGPAKVTWFGAIPTQEKDSMKDSTSAFQAAINSRFSLLVPPGFYYISSPLVHTRYGQFIDFGADGATHWSHRSVVFNVLPASPKTQATIWTDQNIDFFHIYQSGLRIKGGLFDAQNVLAHTKAVFRYLFNGAALTGPDLRAGRHQGWVGDITGFMVVGNRQSLATEGIGTIAVLVDFQSALLENGVSSGYNTHHVWKGRCLDVKAGIVDTPFAEGMGQFANIAHIDLEADSTKVAISLNAIAQSYIKCSFQARDILPLAETPSFAMDIKTSKNYVESVVFDLSSSIGSNGLYRASGAFRPSIGRENFLSPLWGHDANVNFTDTQDTFKGGAILDGSYGIIPRCPHQKQRYGAAISELHNLLAEVDRYPGVTYSFDAYKGTSVNNFDLLLTDSASASIPLSNEIAMTNLAEIWSVRKTTVPPSIKATPTGVADGDYVELVLDGNMLASQIDMMWIALNRSNTGLAEVQIIVYDTNLTLRENKRLALDARARNFHRSPGITRFLMSGATPGRIIIRLIGLRSTGTLNVYDIGGADGSDRSPPPFIGRHGGEAWRDVVFRKDAHLINHAWDKGSLLRMGNYRLWVDGTGKLRIKNGVPSSDTDGNAVGN